MGYKEEQAVLNTQTEVPCPGGGRDQRCKLSDIVSKSSLRTQKVSINLNPLHKVKQNQLLKIG